MDLFDRKQQPITDWRNWTRPKKEDGHWKAGRSAMELARAWFTSPIPLVPPEVAELLESHPLTRATVLNEGWPEWKTALPEKGEGRNHDLILKGQANGKSLLVAVEGKVDETMGPSVTKYWSKSKASKDSKAWRRIEVLLRSVFGENAVPESKPWAQLPYQMLTATVGTAIEAHARSCEIGILCLQEFITESARRRLVERNERDFGIFLSALGHSEPRLGTLYGPFQVVVPNRGVNLPILIGKTQYRWVPANTR